MNTGNSLLHRVLGWIKVAVMPPGRKSIYKRKPIPKMLRKAFPCHPKTSRVYGSESRRLIHSLTDFDHLK
jgi:hypothetical protein